MGYNELEIELRKTLAQISHWREMGYMPMIEQGIALGRLQKIYAGLLDMPCSEPEAQLEEPGVVGDAVVTDDTAGEEEAEGMDRDGTGPDDESFEACCDSDVSAAPASSGTEAAEDDDFADLPAEEGSRVSVETHLQQEYWSHDPCPSPTEFPEDIAGGNAASADAPATDKGEDGVVSDTAAIRESDRSAADLSSNRVSEQEPTESLAEVPRIFGIEVSPYARHEIIDTLFHGNAELFETECAKLDAMDSLEEALVYIGETYRWIPENAATIKFVDLLETRFEE